MQRSPILQDRLKALILILTVVFLADKLAHDEELYFFLGQRIALLLIPSVLLAGLIASSYRLLPKSTERDNAARPSGDHQPVPGWTLLVIVIPLIIGLVVHVQPPLDATDIPHGDAIRQRAAFTSPDASASLAKLTQQRDLIDWVRIRYADPDPDLLVGAWAVVDGRVYQGDPLPDDQIILFDYAMTGSVADIIPFGIVVQLPDGQTIPPDVRVRVSGTFILGDYKGQPTPILIPDDFQFVVSPIIPYLYP